MTAREKNAGGIQASKEGVVTCVMDFARKIALKLRYDFVKNCECSFNLDAASAVGSALRWILQYELLHNSGTQFCCI